MSDRAVVPVDETMTTAQLYVAMSRGRQQNWALVVTGEHDPDEHARGVDPAGMEQLVRVLRRDRSDRSDRSAHEVPRSSLARSEDHELVAGMRDVMTERIEGRAGPDMLGQITEPAARDDLPAARSGLQVAKGQLQDAKGSNGIPI